MASPIPLNTFALKSPSETNQIDTTGRSKIGFKNVIAMKAWSGIFGPKSPEWNPVTKINGDGSCEEIQGPVETPDTIKYLTVSAAANYGYQSEAGECSDDFSGVASASKTRSSSINRISGFNTVTGSDSSTDSYSDGQASSLIGMAFWNVGNAVADFLFWVGCAILWAWCASKHVGIWLNAFR